MLYFIIGLSMLPLFVLAFLLVDMTYGWFDKDSPFKGMYTSITLLTVTALVLMAALVLTL